MDEINDYNNISETDDRREIIKQKLRQYYCNLTEYLTKRTF